MKIIATIVIINSILSQKFCFCLNEDDGVKINLNEPISFEERVKEELKEDWDNAAAGMIKHYKIPTTFKDFGRRFVFQYPYTEKDNAINITDESSLDKVIKQYLREKERSEPSIIPVKVGLYRVTGETVPIFNDLIIGDHASPEFVLAVAKQSALLQAVTPINPADEVMQRNILRTGNYWNDVVEEQVNPAILRSKSRTKIDLIKLQFLPGSTLYELVSELKKISPRLLYVLHDDSE